MKTLGTMLIGLGAVMATAGIAGGAYIAYYRPEVEMAIVSRSGAEQPISVRSAVAAYVALTLVALGAGVQFRRRGESRAA